MTSPPVTMRPFQTRCRDLRGLPGADPASLVRRRHELWVEATTPILKAWERVHEADAVGSRLAARGCVPPDAGFEDDLARLAAHVGQWQESGPPPGVGVR